MNVNDVVCVGAEPIALLDYLAVEQADPDVMRQIAVGPQARAPSWPASRSPAASSRSCPSSSAATRRRTASTSPRTCFGTVALDAIVTGADAPPGRRADRPAVLGPALQRLHARPPRAVDGARARRPPGARSAAPPSPTRCSSRRSSTCARSLDLLRSGVPSTASPTSPAAACSTCPRLSGDGRLRDRPPAPGPAGLRPHRATSAASPTPRCGRSSTWAAASSPSSRRPTPSAAAALLARATRAARRIGTVTDRPREVRVPPAGVTLSA